MLIENKEIAIVGGGPGGLTLARLLQLKGAKVKVYERDINEDARVQGSPLDLHDESGLAALRKANLLNEFKKNFRPGADKMLIVNGNAEVLYSDHEIKPAQDFGSEQFRPEIDRGPLRKLLLESLHPETVIWNSHFISMEKQNNGWLLHFRNGSSFYADIVIAADGANSKVRPYITSITPFYSGITMLEGNIYDAEKSIPEIFKLIKGGKIMAFDDSKCLLLGTKAGDEIGFYASLKVQENWARTNNLDYQSKNQILQWFKQEYANWSKVWEVLFVNATTPFIPRPIYCMPLDQFWVTLPNLTMLGDAAHVMPPFAGEGVNMAMLDALQLCECLTTNQFNTIQEAITCYESNMRKRASAAAKDSLENGERMHSENGLNAMLNLFREH